MIFYVNRIIQQTIHIANALNDPRKQKYFVLLIITDGAIMDMAQTIDAIIQAANTTPISVRKITSQRTVINCADTLFL